MGWGGGPWAGVPGLPLMPSSLEQTSAGFPSVKGEGVWNRLSLWHSCYIGLAEKFIRVFHNMLQGAGGGLWGR